MKGKKHILNDIWEQFPEVKQSKGASRVATDIEHIFSHIFSIGPFYFYSLNILNSTIEFYNNAILEIHGLSKLPKHLKNIIDFIHPDDIAFVRDAENWSLIKMRELGFEHQMNLKTSYCFRMKVADGSYQLFLHQALHTMKDENGALLQAVNIHTNIQHIATQNNFVATLTGIGNRKDFYQYHYQPVNTPETKERLTKRELEVALLLSKGYSDKKISEIMNVSFHTARTHRRNILRKTMTKNGSELVKKCIELGYL